MDKNKVILCNIIATYSRTVLIMIGTFLTSRWLLASMGKTDYGLWGLIGGLTLFVAFINSLLSNSVSRYYAFAEGECQAGKNSLVITQWFNTALAIHLVTSSVLIVIGYPIGKYAILHWLTIPGDRIEQCIWVFRFSCISCYAGMVSVPFTAMFIAKQEITEYTMFLMLVPVLNVIFAYNTTLHERNWLIPYSVFYAGMNIAIYSLICFRAKCKFPECKFNLYDCFNKSRLKDLFGFASWQCFGNLGSLVRSQGMSILGNIEYGPDINASITIANKVSSQTDSLSVSMLTAFSPAITSSYGAKDYDLFRKYTRATNKIGTILVLIFALPILLEIDEILLIWLKNPPEHTASLCSLILVSLVIDKSTAGHMLAVSASGKIALYQSVLGSFLIFSLPLAYILIKIGFGVPSIGYSILVTTSMCAFGRLFLAKTVIQVSVMQWIKKVFFPTLLVVIFSFFFGYLPHLFLDMSVKRLLLTLVLSEISIFFFSACFVLEDHEKKYVLNKISQILDRVFPRHSSCG